MKQQQKFLHAYSDILSTVNDIQDTHFQINQEIYGMDQTFSCLRQELKPSQQARLMIDCE